MLFLAAGCVMIALWRPGHTVDRRRMGAYSDPHR